MIISLRHCTRYLYDRPVTLGPHEIRLKPVPACSTPVSGYVLTVSPARHTLHWHHDAAGNAVARVLFQDKTPLLKIDVALTADLAPVNPFDFLVEPGADRYPICYPEAARPDLAPYLAANGDGEQVQRWLENWRASERLEGRGTVDLLVNLNLRIQRDIAYVTRLEQGVQSCDDTLRLGKGSCRDSSWLLVQLLRRLGFAARFVSGYLIQLASDDPGAPRSDQADLHAWAETYLPGAGWIGLDPTSGMLAAEGHIPLARAATPALAAPVTGSVEPCNSQMQFSITVQRQP